MLSVYQAELPAHCLTGVAVSGLKLLCGAAAGTVTSSEGVLNPAEGSAHADAEHPSGRNTSQIHFDS